MKKFTLMYMNSECLTQIWNKKYALNINITRPTLTKNLHFTRHLTDFTQLTYI